MDEHQTSESEFHRAYTAAQEAFGKQIAEASEREERYRVHVHALKGHAAVRDQALKQAAGMLDVLAGIARPDTEVRAMARQCAELAREPLPDMPEGPSAITEERDRLRAAIVAHRAQKADDRCIEDDDRLYAALGDGIKCDRRVGDKAAMIANCVRFIANRCEGGAWPSYAELEAEIKRLQKVIYDARVLISQDKPTGAYEVLARERP